MKWFLNLATRTKLFLGFGLMIALLALVIGISYKCIMTMHQWVRSLAEVEFANVANLKDVQFNQNVIRGDSIAALVMTDRGARQALFKDGDECTKRNDELVRKLLDREKNHPEHHARLEEFDEIRKIFRETREKQVVPLILEGKSKEAMELATGIQAERNQKMGVIVAELVREAEKEAQNAVSLSVETASESIRILLVVGAITLGLAVGFTLLLSRVIASPLNEISRTAEQIVTGDLTVNVPVDDRGDEVGVLAAAFRKMVATLRDVNKKIIEGVTVLFSSATEIMTSTSQLVSSATETAAAVSETTTTVEEVKQTAQVSAEKSKSVSESAQKAASVAQQGSAAVTKTVDEINNIRILMETVAESVVKLSEQTLAIGEIITSVSDLAQQSNLLAVNAAIEASKAGEHGRGFAVVAQEIKILADQSKQATEQVRDILGDIQKATSSSVMAAEQVSKAVDGAVKQAAHSGESIGRLAESITESANAATQIAASSQQQFVGIDQISLAMENIKQASQQNVAGAKQAEQAAHNLNALGHKLKEMVEKFRV
ncbi:MAG: methyl-accepting chemotaxis protein [Deltaproteobacteria bacterium]|nr:methyl-accepting chemotaxis protein [Deltaproteobacteria bacterium]